MNESRLKQRLVGAAVLVALGVIFIPMLLSGPDPLDELVVRDTVPERPSERRREEVTLSDPPERPEVPEVAAVPVDEHVADGGGEDDALPPPRLGAGGRPGEAEPEAGEAVDAAPEETVAAEAPDPDEDGRDGAADDVTEPPDEAEAAIPEGQTHAWSVQVGSFSERGNGKALRDRLRDSGFSAYVERRESDGGAVYRVRVGPVMEREAADELRLDIHEESGVRGMVMRHSID